jgi:hypothetical protein
MLGIYETQGLNLSLAWKECTVSNFGVSDKKNKDSRYERNYLVTDTVMYHNTSRIKGREI